MYHIKKDGLPGPCRAQSGNCPLGGSDEHYPTKLEAIVAAEKKLLEENKTYLDAVQKNDELYHIGEDGAVEVCPFRPGHCKVMPYGTLSNKHSNDEAEAESFARALREIQAKTAPGSVTSKPAPKPTSYSDAVTKQARKILEDGWDVERQKGWTEEEIKKGKAARDTCGHYLPERFQPKRTPTYGC